MFLFSYPNKFNGFFYGVGSDGSENWFPFVSCFQELHPGRQCRRRSEITKGQSGCNPLLSALPRPKKIYVVSSGKGLPNIAIHIFASFIIFLITLFIRNHLTEILTCLLKGLLHPRRTNLNTLCFLRVPIRYNCSNLVASVRSWSSMIGITSSLQAFRVSTSVIALLRFLLCARFGKEDESLR